jgi:mono/diheme cytochrome c family protein
MSLSTRLRPLSILLFMAAGLAPLDYPFGLVPASRAQYPTGQDAEGPDLIDPGMFGQLPDEGNTYRRGRRPRTKAAASKKGRSAKDVADKSEKTNASATAKRAGGEGSPSGLKFSQDIAPILVANCVGCHKAGGAGLKRGKLDLTSFAKMMEGTPKEKVIIAGKPNDSHLILRIKGEETPKMPQGGNDRSLADEAIAKIEQWVKAGAKLDAGIDAKAAMESYAASPEQIRRGQVARLSPKERDQKIEAAGRDRWKQANPKLKPDIVPGDHFVLFSNLPRDRATATVKAMEAEYMSLKRLLGSPATDWVEKVSLYVFNDRKDFVEFARTVEQHEVSAEVSASGNLAVPQPYVAAVDPLGGKKEEPSASHRRPRGKKADEKEAAGGPDRTLIGLLTEHLAESAVISQGKSPRWLAQGFGAFLSAQVEPRSPYYQRLRQTAWQIYDKGWLTKATEALGEGTDVSGEEVRAVGFAVVESLMAPNFRPAFPAFARGMSAGNEKLDDVLTKVYAATRDDFLKSTGEWVAARYGRDQ